MFSETKIRKWHRTNAFILAPLLFLQALSGLVVAFEILLGMHEDVVALLDAKEAHTLHYAWENLLLDIHFGGGPLGDIYHIVLVFGIFSLMISGATIHLFARRRKMKKGSNKAL